MTSIEYVGANGERHAFSVNSPDEARLRLSRIHGYLDGNADKMTEAFMSAVAKRDRRLAERRAERLSAPPALGSPYGVRADSTGATKVSVLVDVSRNDQGGYFRRYADIYLPAGIRVEYRNEPYVSPLRAGSASYAEDGTIVNADGRRLSGAKTSLDAG